MNSRTISKFMIIFWAVFVSAFAIFILICIYMTDACGIGAVIIGSIVCCILIAASIWYALTNKGNDHNIYDPDGESSKATLKKIKEAYDEHRLEQDTKKLLELELKPSVEVMNKGYIDRMMSLISEKIYDREEFNRDYFSGEIFRGPLCFLSVGNLYTLYTDTEKNQFIIENCDIIMVEPYIQNIEIYSYGIYAGTQQHFYIRIYTCDKTTYTLRCADYMDRPIMDAYWKRCKYLHPDFRLYLYPEQRNG